MQKVADVLNQRYGAGTVMLEITDSYKNMAEQIKPHWHLIEIAYAALTEECGNPQCKNHDVLILSNFSLPPTHTFLEINRTPAPRPFSVKILSASPLKSDASGLVLEKHQSVDGPDQ